MFKPALFDTLKNYSGQQFRKDLMAGFIVGIIALPLAVAFSIASGVSPEKGLYTAIVAGFIISALGGSRVQIGGPTGAFIIIVYGIVQAHGVNGLIIATFMAGIILVVMGLSGLGSVIKFIPHPLIAGFTTGIAVLIFSSQVKDFFGLRIDSVPAAFVDKWNSYLQHFHSVNMFAFFTAITTVAIIFLTPKITYKVPGSLIAVILTTAATHLLHLPVETIGSRFGNISSSLPVPAIPGIEFSTVKDLIQPAFTIALLGGIESLLSAMVADGMTGATHRSNTELVAQGIANIFSSVFGGIPATGAIARTAANIKNGGRTPIAGIVHAITLLLIMLFAGRWIALIPLASLSGILVVVAYNMSEWESFISSLKGPRSDAAVLLSTFLMTVFIDLTVAIETAMVLAAFLFMRKMIRFSGVNAITTGIYDNSSPDEPGNIDNFFIPKNIAVFEITGPMFFGAVYKFKDAMRIIALPPKVLIIRMKHVPIIDATGLKALRDVSVEAAGNGTKVILSEVTSTQVMYELRKTRLLFAIGKANVTDTFGAALKRAANYATADIVV